MKKRLGWLLKIAVGRESRNCRNTRMHLPPQTITYVHINFWGHEFENIKGPRHLVDVFASISISFVLNVINFCWVSYLRDIFIITKR